MRRNIAGQTVCVQLIDKTTGSVVTSGTTSVYVTLDGGTQAAGTGTITHKGNGQWVYFPTAGETDGKHIALTFVNSSAVPVSINVYTVAVDMHDTAGLGLSRIDAAVSTRLASASYTAAPTAADVRTEMDTNSTKLANLDATVSSRATAATVWTNGTRALTDKANFTLSVTPPTAAQIRTEMDTNSTKLDVAVGTRLATSGYTAPSTAPTVAQIRTEMDTNSTKLDVAVGTRLATAGYTTPPTVQAVRTEIDTNSTKLDVAVGTRLATAGYTAGITPADVWGHSSRSLTDKAGFSLSASEHLAIAVKLLTLDLSTVAGEAGRSVLNAVRFLRNKWSIAGTTLTVCKEDDATPAWTAQVTTEAGAQPVTGTDPA